MCNRVASAADQACPRHNSVYLDVSQSFSAITVFIFDSMSLCQSPYHEFEAPVEQEVQMCNKPLESRMACAMLA